MTKKFLTPIHYNVIYYTKEGGKYKITKDYGIIAKRGNYNKYRYVEIAFIENGHTCMVKHGDAINGRVRDPYIPTILGIGYLGRVDDAYSYYEPIYYRWTGILHRCYDPTNKHYNAYGALGVHVCERWHGFEYFYHDFKLLPGYDQYLKDPSYQIDKDIRQRNIPIGQRVYSPETCILVSPQLNTAQKAVDYADAHDDKYIGVQANSHGNTYRMEFIYNGNKHCLFGFRNPIAAANMYNNFVKFKYPELPINDNIPYMSPQEVQAANTLLKEMCHIVKKEDK